MRFLSDLPARLRQLVRVLPRPAAENLIPWIAFLFGCGLTIWAHLWFTRPRPTWLNIDEGYVAAIAERMLSGHGLPYVDGVSHRGPMLYWVGALAVAIGGPSWMTVRIASLLVALLSMAVVFACGLRSGRPLAGSVGALALVFECVLVLGPNDGVALNGEPVLNLFVLGALLALVVGLDPRRERPNRAACLVAGILTMFGILSKQVAILMMVPFGLWVVARSFASPAASRRQRWAPVLAFAAGATAPLILLFLIYAIAGQLRALVYWMITYNLTVYMAPFTRQMRKDLWLKWPHSDLQTFLLAILGATWALTRPLFARARGLFRALDERGFELTVGLSAVAALIGGKMALRGWGHYWVQAVPWWGLLVGILLEPAPDASASRPSRWKPLLYHAVLLVPACVLLVSGTVLRFDQWDHEKQMGGGRGWDMVDADLKLCRYIQEHVKPDQPIFVWGFEATLYVTCQREPASRFVFTTMVAGLVPWIDQGKLDDDRLAAPGSRATLVADLMRSQPPLIVDSAGSIRDRPMRRYEELARFLDEHYRFVGMLEGRGIYLRGKPGRRVLWNFEREGYAGWTATGHAFENGPSGVQVPRESLIMGQEGQRLANSFHLQLLDSATGTLTSPPFLIDRTRLAFLVGGGGSARVELLVGGTVVYQASGRRSEQLSHTVWDVRKFLGHQAQMRLVDDDLAGWGHILCDLVELYDADDPVQPLSRAETTR